MRISLRQNVILENTNNFKKIPAKCFLYEPLSETEGECWDESIVSRLGGCDNPENCDRYNKSFKNNIK